MQASLTRADPGSSRDRLRDAAEKLVALKGEAGATNRAIIAAAGQRHNSAITYHFGTRRALLDAVWAHRSAAVDHHRRPLLEGLRDPTLEDLVRVYVEPLTRYLDEVTPSYWARFNEQSLHRYPLQLPAQLRTDLASTRGESGLATLLDVFEQMEKLTCDGVEPAASLRVTQAVRAVITTLAAWERERDAGSATLDARTLGTHLVPAITGLLSAPR